MFNIPNLPTDNLYKFKFLGGITIYIFVAYIYSTQIIDSINKLKQCNVEIYKLESQKETLKGIKEEMNSDLKYLNANFGKISNENTELENKNGKEEISKEKNNQKQHEFPNKNDNGKLPISINIERLNSRSEKLDKFIAEFNNNCKVSQHC